MDNTEINSALSIKEERLRLALEKTNTGLFEWYPITNKTYYSPTWFTMLGYDSDELPHSYETWSSLLHPEDKPVIEKLLQEFIHTPRTNFNVEFRMLAKHGEYIWIYDQGVAAERDESGHLIRMVGIHSDITERKRDEEILKLKETRYQSFVANSSEHIWCVEFTVPVPLNLPEMEQVEHILDHAYYSEANEAFAQAYGATSEEVIGWPLEKTVSRSLPTTIPTLLEIVRSGYKLINMESVEVTKDGSEITLLNNFIGTIQDGQVIRVWGTARDITVHKQAEERLKLKEIRYQSFTANSSEHIWCVDFTVPIPLNLPEKEQIEHILDHGYYSEANEAFAQAYGATSEEVIGWPLVKTFPRSSPSTYEFLQSVIRSGYKMTDVETLEVTKDGSEITLLNNFIGTIQDGQVQQVWGTARDITKRKKAEEELKLNEEKLKNILQNLPDSVSRYEFKPKRGFSFLSSSTKKLFGYPIEDFYADPDLILKIVHPDDRHLTDTYLERLVNNEMPFIMRYIHKNGKTIVTETRSIPIYNDKGELIANESINRDITEFEKAVKDLRESEERCRLALEASNDGILDWNIEGGNISFSPAVYHMLGYKPFEFSETIESFYQHIHPDDQESRDIDGYKKLYAFTEDNRLSDEFRMLKKDGKLIWVKLSVKVVKKGEDGKPLRIMGTLTDITANKNRTKELIEAILLVEDNERSRISQDIHDGLQQTLILASINLKPIKKELANKSSKVKEQFEIGLQYLNDSISESRVMAHSLMPKSIADFGIIGAFESTIDRMNMSTRHTQFNFHHNLKTNSLENKPLELTLYRVFQEATNNIIKHSGAKNVDIQLKNYKDVLILAIEDDGVGFDTTKLKKENLGFGFKTIRNRLDAINATLEIESSPDKGTVIIVRLNK